VQYESEDGGSNSLDVLATDQMANATIIPLPTEAIIKRLGKGQHL
jgi:hypothetical protein